jgi:hypothetical protein
MTVVGVVRDSVFRSIRSPDEPTIYLPLGQDPDPILTTNFYLGVRSTRQPPQQLTRAVSAAFRGVNRDIVLKARPISDEVREEQRSGTKWMSQSFRVAWPPGFVGSVSAGSLGVAGTTA